MRYLTSFDSNTKFQSGNCTLKSSWSLGVLRLFSSRRLLGVFIWYFMDISLRRMCLWLHSWLSRLFRPPYLPWKDKKTLCRDCSCIGHSSHRGNYPLIVLSSMVCEWLYGTWGEWTNLSFRLGLHAWKWYALSQKQNKKPKTNQTLTNQPTDRKT